MAAANEVGLLDIAFHRSMKPEGSRRSGAATRKKILVIDDGGGYAVVGYPGVAQ
jgi:hypothetical protein